MAQDYNLGLAFLRQAEATPAAEALLFRDGRLRYAEMQPLVVFMAQHLQARGLGAGDTILVRAQDPAVVLVSLFASALLGMRWSYGHDDLLTDRRLNADIVLQADDEPVLPKGVRLDESWARPPETAMRAQFPGYLDPDEAWLLHPVEGRRGRVELVALSPKIVMERLRSVSYPAPPRGARIVSLFPPGSWFYLSEAIAALTSGGCIVAGMAPEQWASAKVTLVIGASGHFLSLCETSFAPPKLPRARIIGNRLPETVLRHLLSHFDNLELVFGPIEIGPVTAEIVTERMGGELNRLPVPCAGQFEIVDAEGNMVPEGDEGILRLRSPSLVLGYLAGEDANTAAFDDGWLYSGDLARTTPAGELVLTGRTDEWLKIGEEYVSAQLLDRILQGVSGIDDAITFMMPRPDRTARLTAFLAITPGTHPSDIEASAKIAVLSAAGRAAVPERFLFADKLPRTSTGRADRDACMAMVIAMRAQRANERRKN
ncbi:class I adenylate-forming enzyme family protein [Thioclava pacifica]|uniref:AMP-dependent synthetase/ligase domain-containing protein n=1 Tax=Thioclava pacifica DSM 10166 TaxID=1353537 RepID=A0A074JN41_9RHOB|nr:class I adenylate-forming enzyme family protein [Thioclava pacifica]KEO50797.1 hypothetical protein TP2_14310 [Thioclava pacifica DSM 10166]